MEFHEWKSKTATTYWCWIYIAGNKEKIEQSIRQYVICGLCVTLETVDYIYTGGLESGVRIGLINYPRFPETDILQHAINLGKIIAEENGQISFSIIDPVVTYYFSRADK